jgi:hypothetical protein
MKPIYSVSLLAMMAACSEQPSSSSDSREPDQLTLELDVDGEKLRFTSTSPAVAQLFDSPEAHSLNSASMKASAPEHPENSAVVGIGNFTLPFGTYALGPDSPLKLVLDGEEYGGASGSLRLAAGATNRGLTKFEGTLDAKVTASDGHSVSVTGRLSGQMSISCMVPATPDPEAGSGVVMEGGDPVWVDDTERKSSFCESLKP